jgi:hypothetical protein
MAIEGTLREGWRTADVADRNSKIVGTKEMGARVARHLEVIMDSGVTRS